MSKYLLVSGSLLLIQTVINGCCAYGNVTSRSLPDLYSPPNAFKEAAFWLKVEQLFAIQLAALVLEGRPLYSPTGSLAVWEGDVTSKDASQTPMDPYTLSHIVSGVVLYYLTNLLPVSVKKKYLISLLIHVTWEVVENTPYFLKHYGKKLDKYYRGDSILNSMTDSVAMSFGFLMAWKLPKFILLMLFIMEEIVISRLIGENHFTYAAKMYRIFILRDENLMRVFVKNTKRSASLLFE